MDGKLPSWAVNSEQNHGLAENTQCEALANTNDLSTACGKILTEENYSAKWDENVPNASPESLHCQGACASMQGFEPEVASSTSSFSPNASVADSPDCLPGTTTTEPIKNCNFPADQHPSMDSLIDIPEDCIERKQSMTINNYNSVNDQLAAVQEENLNSDVPVTKETLEMSNAMELVQNLLVDVCESPPIHDPSTESRAVELVKSDDPIDKDNELHIQERREMTEVQEQESAVIILSDDSKKFLFKPNQDFEQKTESVDPLIDGPLLNAEKLCEMMHDASEVCSLTQITTTQETQDSYSTIDPIRSNMHEQCNKHISCASLPTTSRTENDELVLRQVIENSSHRTSSEHAQSCINVSTGKCIEICTDNIATLHEHLSVHNPHLKVDTEPNPESTSHNQHSLVCNLQKGNTPPITCIELPMLEHYQMSVEISNNCIETKLSSDVPIIAAQSSCKKVGKVENGAAHMLDDHLPCSQNHCSCELASSDTSNTSLMTSYTESEPNTGQIITQNVMNVGTVSEDTPAHYVSQGQSQSLTDSANPETSVNSVPSIEIKSTNIMSEVNSGTPQTPTDFLETETSQVEPYKNLSTPFVQPECKKDPELESSCANQYLVSSSVRMKKRVVLSLKKRRLLKMAKAFSKSRATLGNAHGLQENRRGNFSGDLEKIHVKAKKQQSPPLVEKSRKSHKENHTGQVFNTSPGLQPNHFQKASNEKGLLGCFGNPLETEDDDEKHENVSRSSKTDFHPNPCNTLLKMPSESQNNNSELKESRKPVELNSDEAFELSLQSTVNSAGFRSGITNAFSKKLKNKKSKLLMDLSLKAADQHPGALSEKKIGEKNPECNKSAILFRLSPFRKIDRFTQYCDEDHATALNYDACSAADAVKSTKIGKNYISCKYCCRSFRHISAYTVHRRIHTGEKPYRCEICGKNFAQLAKLKSHRNVHVQSDLWPCPCCGKEFFEKRDLMAHFMTHLKESKWINKPSQQDDKPDVPITSPTHSKRINISTNKFPTDYMRKFHKHTYNKLMSCKTCGQEFTSFQLVAHEKTHWPVKPYACSVCAKGFNRLKALKKHSEKHTGDTPFSCSHCRRAFSDLSALRLHQLSKLCNPKLLLNGEHCDLEGFLISHGVDGQVNTPMFFKCQLCKRLYQKWCQYTLHLQTHTKTPSYVCLACGQSYEKDSVVDVHCRVCCQTSGEKVACGSSLSEILHSDARTRTSLSDSSPADLDSIEDPNDNSPSSAGRFHKNSQTPKSNLQRHLTPESSRFIRASSLSENVSHDSHLPSSPTPSVITCVPLNESQECVEISPRLWRFKCPRCGQRFKRYRALCLHTQAHPPTFKYVCGPCGHSFKRWNKLWLHQRIHRRKGQGYTCLQCNIRFHFFNSYRMHLLSHSEVRPYACSLCRQTFAHEEDLHVHQCSLHQPSRKLQCDVCSRSFSNLTKFLKHSLLHNGAISHQCLQCNLSFPNNKSLRKHLNAHSSSASLLPSIPSEPFTFLYNCNRCKSSFSTSDLLFAHQICHTRKCKNRVQSTQSRKSTSTALGGTRSSTNRSLLLTLDTIPEESVFKYPHPDKLYVPPHLLKRSKRIPIINLVSGDEQEGSIGHSGQITQETNSKIQGCSEKQQDDPSHNNLTQFAETSVILEQPATSVNAAENEIQDEIFECADCSEKLGSLGELFEHYFLHALGNTHF